MMLRARWEVLDNGRYRGVIVDDAESPARILWTCEHEHFSILGDRDVGFGLPDLRPAKRCAEDEIARRAEAGS
jgi:hypothetical protein